ncbi:hypothetical protein L3Y34_011496 [Caenorhabditis briggsae]|uniref:Uncharacterized protein n=1 Tax=Caenorhabditis briggsae TaxID=6238 RepID=A0AAE8ZRF5_CAEBR|nr:hypothetical protein L3Y34_011496 [Caenorhabditis briggsae]
MFLLPRTYNYTKKGVIVLELRDVALDATSDFVGSTIIEEKKWTLRFYYDKKAQAFKSVIKHNGEIGMRKIAVSLKVTPFIRETRKLRPKVIDKARSDESQSGIHELYPLDKKKMFEKMVTEEKYCKLEVTAEILLIPLIKLMVPRNRFVFEKSKLANACGFLAKKFEANPQKDQFTLPFDGKEFFMENVDHALDKKKPFENGRVFQLGMYAKVYGFHSVVEKVLQFEANGYKNVEVPSRLSRSGRRGIQRIRRRR